MRHAPWGRFGIDDFSKAIAAFGERGNSFRRITTRQKNEKFEDSSADGTADEFLHLSICVQVCSSVANNSPSFFSAPRRLGDEFSTSKSGKNPTSPQNRTDPADPQNPLKAIHRCIR
jgi:hypothetical protein